MDDLPEQSHGSGPAVRPPGRAIPQTVERFLLWLFVGGTGGALVALFMRSGREQWCSSSEIGSPGEWAEILIAALIVIVAFGFALAALIVALRRGPASPLLAIGLGLVAGLALSTFVPHPDCSDPNLVPSSGTIVVDLASDWDRRLSGPASCASDRRTGALLTVVPDDASSYGAWETDGWNVLVSIDDYRAPAAGSRPDGEASLAVRLDQAATNPYQVAYWVREGSSVQATTDTDGLGGTVWFRSLVLDTDLDQLPFDPGRQTRPFPVPKMLDVTVIWDCRGGSR